MPDQNMENQNGTNQSGNQSRGGVKPNPSRYNKNIKEGQGNGERVEAQNDENRNVEVDTAGLDRDEVNLDRSGVGHSEGGQENELAPDQNQSSDTNQGLQAGSGADYGSGAVRGKSGQQAGQQDQSGAANQRGNQLNRNQDDSKLQ